MRWDERHFVQRLGTRQTVENVHIPISILSHSLNELENNLNFWMKKEFFNIIGIILSAL